MSTEKISLPQVMMLMVISRLSLTLVYFGTPPAFDQDVWWESFLAALVAIAIPWLTGRIARRFPQQTLLQVAELTLSRPVGRLIALLYLLYFLLVLTLNLRLVGEFFVFAFLTRTPIIVVIITVALLALWAVRSGVEVIGRFSQVIFPLLIASVFLIVLFLAQDIETKLLWPPRLSAVGPVPYLQDIINVSARTAEFAWLALLVPFVDQPAGLFRTAVRAQLWIGFAWVGMSVAIIGTLGRNFSPHFFPFYVSVQLVHVGDFLERPDVLFLSMWLFGMFLRITMLLWGTAVSAAQLLGLKTYRMMALPFAGIAATYALMIAGSFAEVQGFLAAEVFTPFGLIFVLLLPLLMLGVARLRRMRRPPPWQPPIQAGATAPGGESAE